MTVTFSQIINFPLFYQQIKGEKLPIRTVYKLSQLAEQLDFHLKFYRENLQNIITRYSAKDEVGETIIPEDGKGFIIEKQNEINCLKEIEELQNLEVSIPEIKFNLSEFEKAELTLEALESVKIFIEE